jgi:hypothetical protein
VRREFLDVTEHSGAGEVSQCDRDPRGPEGEAPLIGRPGVESLPVLRDSFIDNSASVKSAHVVMEAYCLGGAEERVRIPLGIFWGGQWSVVSCQLQKAWAGDGFE